MSEPAPDMPPMDAGAAQFLKPGEQMICYACRARDGLCQFGIQSVSPDGERTILARLVCPARYEGGPQVAHGGWTAAVFDEVMGHLGPLNGGLTVTGKLEVDYVRPVPIERPVEIRARLEGVEGRRWRVTAEMVLPETGAVLGRARGLFIHRKPAHFDNHRRWMEAQDRR